MMKTSVMLCDVMLFYSDYILGSLFGILNNFVLFHDLVTCSFCAMTISLL